MAITVNEIRKIILDLKVKGYDIESIEAFLVNRDDLNLLCQSVTNSQGEQICDQTTNGVRICGVKIIESPYVPQGTIYKLFKKGLQLPFDNIGANGTMPAPDFLMNIEGSSTGDVTVTVPVSGQYVMPNYVPKSPPIPIVPEEPIPIPIVQKKLDKKHSSKRRIELD